MEFTQKDVDVLNTRIEQTSDPEEKAALIKIRDEITEILGKKAIVAPKILFIANFNPKAKDAESIKKTMERFIKFFFILPIIVKYPIIQL